MIQSFNKCQRIKRSADDMQVREGVSWHNKTIIRVYKRKLLHAFPCALHSFVVNFEWSEFNEKGLKLLKFLVSSSACAYESSHYLSTKKQIIFRFWKVYSRNIFCIPPPRWIKKTWWELLKVIKYNRPLDSIKQVKAVNGSNLYT